MAVMMYPHLQAFKVILIFTVVSVVDLTLTLLVPSLSRLSRMPWQAQPVLIHKLSSAIVKQKLARLHLTV